jgi:hypothetical protein
VRRSAVVLVALLALPVATAGAQAVPPGLSREQPVSVAGTTISLAEIRHWARVGARSVYGPRRGRPSRTAFEFGAQFVIRQRWVDGEARAQGVRVTPRQVSRRLLRQIHGTFDSWRELHAFLRENRQTFADLRVRARLELLTEQLQERAVGDITDPDEAAARLDAWTTAFLARWRARTLCTPRFAVPQKGRPPTDCGNGPTE